jgi:hypothetical protein
MWLGLGVLGLVLFLWWKKKKADAGVDTQRANRVAREPAF